MPEKINAPRGTQDLTPAEVQQITHIERTAAETAQRYGYFEMRFPTFEHTELFARGVGDTTDVVQKEMYTFPDKGGRSITLRPEGTAGAVRAAIAGGMLGDALPFRAAYLINCFRYEKPQAGRLREFRQFGVEVIGSDDPRCDAEVILVGNAILRALQFQNISLEINSIGCPACRPLYHQALRDYLSAREGDLCGTCRDRLARNPMRVLDCKSPVCADVVKSAPTPDGYLCPDCAAHYRGLRHLLDQAGLCYVKNPRIVRGLDYYTRTVFEFVSGDVGSQSTVCGGGRYNGLVEMLGGPALSGIGFAMGIDRLYLAAKNQGLPFPVPRRCDVFFASQGDAGADMAARLAEVLRAEGFYAQNDTVGRSLKAQLRYADKLGAQFVAVCGDDEVSTGKLKLKDMATGESRAVDLSNLVSAFYDLRLASGMDALCGALLGERPTL